MDHPVTKHRRQAILRKALEEPASPASSGNAGVEEAAVIVAEIRQKRQRPLTGYNVATVMTGEYLDMIKAGIIDPAKVTKHRACKTRLVHLRPPA